MMQVRMLPVGVLFSKFPRVVRDLARSLGKEINLVVEGEGTEIDRSVIDKIRDPLVHLLRNAVDHGVEPPEGRAAAGKPAQSTLKLTARHEQGQILIALADDGKGIDPAAIREAAVRKGEISQEAADRLSDREALELIFAPGLSTAQQTTEVSGRGVGGDVIRRDIESLNGRVEVESTMGVGTTFTLRLPLTLATFGGLLVVSGGRTYALPLSFVRETVRPEPEQLSSVLTRPMLNLRGEVMPLMPLWGTATRRSRRVATPSSCRPGTGKKIARSRSGSMISSTSTRSWSSR
jgi:two-component system chemotaxis sensor kinase CheA